MRRPCVLVVAGLLLATACSSPEAQPAVKGSRSETPTLSASPAPSTSAPSTSTSSTSSTSVYSRPTAPPPGSPLPQPIAIPADSYAPEQVVTIGSMEIAAIGLKQTIYQGVTLRNIDKGPSHWTGSAMPGQMGNTVFAGHRATNGRPFRRIDELVPGDEVVFNIGADRWIYRVTGHLIVNPADTWIAIQTAAYTGTLYACHPVGSLAQRYVVQLELIR